MTETYADRAYRRRPSGRHRDIARLDKSQQRQQLSCDTRQWLDSGHRIEQLPPGPVTAAGRLDSFNHFLLETGFIYEL